MVTTGFIHKMKSGFKNGWPSIVRFRLKHKSVTPFCIFSKLKSAGNKPGNTPVYLNVYDLTTVNGYMYWAGVGIFHTGLEGQFTSQLSAYRKSAYMHMHVYISVYGEKLLFSKMKLLCTYSLWSGICVWSS